MPVADFFGRWNWGYDGVLLFAPDSAYGRPDDLKALVDAAHQRGLMVFLDVVYNHFGPEGNYLGRYAPQFFTHGRHAVGQCDRLSSMPEVRALRGRERAAIGSTTFASTACGSTPCTPSPSRGARMLLHELSEAAGALAAQTGRHIHLVLENDANQASLLDPLADPPRGKYRAQWNDDYHHAFHVLLTGETAGYYGDYRDAGASHRARRWPRALPIRASRRRTARAKRAASRRRRLPATAFVNFLQNHDQIGNRALGERLTALAPPAALEAALAVTLLAPAPPLLFMGEEWGAREPFPFFCDFKGELARSGAQRPAPGVRRSLCAAPATTCPIRCRKQTFRLATLDWTRDRQAASTARGSIWCARLLAARKASSCRACRSFEPATAARIRRRRAARRAGSFARGDTLALLANLSERAAAAARRVPARRAGLGRRAAATVAALVGLCRDRSALMPP